MEQHPDAVDASASGGARARIGVVLVGRNESARLIHSVPSARAVSDAVVYVDSNSSDDSRAIAEAHGATVVHLKEGPYTPSRGRQTGFDTLMRQHPDLPYVHFIDGDCVLIPGWVETAYRYLEDHPDVGAVFGRRREERYAESFYSRLMDIDWEIPTGTAAYFGGDALLRTEAVKAAGNWSPTTINAEDLDLSFRVRAEGWTIMQLGQDMATHDARMTRFGEYWRRSVRAGYGFAEVGWRYRHGPGRMLLQRVVSSVLYIVALPLIAVTLAFFWWPGTILVALLYARMLAMLTRRARKHGASWSMALAYAGLNLVCKAASLVGALRFLVDRLRRKDRPSDHLIVYRNQ